MRHEEQFITTAEVAARLLVTPECVTNWIRRKQLPAIRYRGTRKWLIRESDVEKMRDR